MRTQKEIKEAKYRAVDKAEDNPAYFAVVDALQWVLGESDDDPSA